MKRICFYTHFMPNPLIGGVERVTYNLSQAFRQRGYVVFHICQRGDNADAVIPMGLSDEEKSAFVDSFLLENRVDILIDQYGMDFLTHPGIAESVKIFRCCHVNPFAKHLIRSLLETFSWKNLKYSILNLAFIVNTPRRSYINKQFYKRLRNGSMIDKMVYLSDKYKLQVKDRYNIAEKKLAAIPNAIDDGLLGVSSNLAKEKQVMWCGRRAHNSKNVVFLPRLWKRLISKHPDWNLVVVGDGIDRGLLEQRFERYGLHNVQITGNVNPNPYYAQSKIFILPSFAEGFGMVLLESMAHACVPIVFDSSPVFRDIIDDGANGCIVPDLDEDAFIRACDNLMTDEDLLAQMGQKAKEKVEKFSMNKVCDAWKALFNEC